MIGLMLCARRGQLAFTNRQNPSFRHITGLGTFHGQLLLGHSASLHLSVKDNGHACCPAPSSIEPIVSLDPKHHSGHVDIHSGYVNIHSGRAEISIHYAPESIIHITGIIIHIIPERLSTSSGIRTRTGS